MFNFEVEILAKLKNPGRILNCYQTTFFPFFNSLELRRILIGDQFFFIPFFSNANSQHYMLWNLPMIAYMPSTAKYVEGFREAIIVYQASIYGKCTHQQ